MGSTFKVWTHVPVKDMLNIVHVHLNDMSDSVAIDVKYLQGNEYEEFKGGFDKPLHQLFDFSKE